MILLCYTSFDSHFILICLVFWPWCHIFLYIYVLLLHSVWCPCHSMLYHWLFHFDIWHTQLRHRNHHSVNVSCLFAVFCLQGILLTIRVSCLHSSVVCGGTPALFSSLNSYKRTSALCYWSEIVAAKRNLEKDEKRNKEKRALKEDDPSQ